MRIVVMTASRFNPLIVDDEPDIIESISSVLDATLARAVAFAAYDGVEGLAVLAEAEIHLILTNYKMPNMDGIEFLMNCPQVYPKIPRLPLTAFPDPALTARAAKEAGVGLFLAKPLDVSYLVEVLKAFAPD